MVGKELPAYRPNHQGLRAGTTMTSLISMLPQDLHNMILSYNTDQKWRDLVNQLHDTLTIGLSHLSITLEPKEGYLAQSNNCTRFIEVLDLGWELTGVVGRWDLCSLLHKMFNKVKSKIHG